MTNALGKNILFGDTEIDDTEIADKKNVNKKIANKKIADKKIADKKIADKKIVDKKIADAEIEDPEIEDPEIEDSFGSYTSYASSYTGGIPLGKNTTLVSNGIASNAASYAAAIKESTIKLQDSFLIGKYRSDYETAIINLDDFINNLMLQNALSFDKENPETASTKLFELQQAKGALNNVMKYLDTQ
jgi:hypothetical protein